MTVPKPSTKINIDYRLATNFGTRVAGSIILNLKHQYEHEKESLLKKLEAEFRSLRRNRKLHSI